MRNAECRGSFASKHYIYCFYSNIFYLGLFNYNNKKDSGRKIVLNLLILYKFLSIAKLIPNSAFRIPNSINIPSVYSASLHCSDYSFRHIAIFFRELLKKHFGILSFGFLVGRTPAFYNRQIKALHSLFYGTFPDIYERSYHCYISP